MTIHRIYLGAWFPRTSIHLKEILRFLKEKKMPAGLDGDKAEKFHKELNLQNYVFHEEHYCDFVEADFSGGSFTATEDGVILVRGDELLSSDDLDAVNAKKEFLKKYYMEKLGPAINYIFSAGAPLPRDLSRLDVLLPFIMIVSDASKEDIKKLYASAGEEEVSFVGGPDINIHSSPMLVVLLVNNKNLIQQGFIQLEDFVKQSVFFRDTETQLEIYLVKHRVYWDEISKIRDSRSLKFQDFPAMRQRLLDMRRNITYINARLLQMEDILTERARTASPEEKKFLRQMGMYRFESVGSSLRYSRHLWEMTLEYLDGTIALLHTLYEENTQREFAVLKTITFAGAIAGFFGMNIGFPWEDRWSAIKLDSALVMILVIAGPIVFYMILKRMLLKRRFSMTAKGEK